MKRRFFLIIMTLVLVLTLGACSLESKKVELGVSASFKHEMVEGTSQKVEIEIADSTVDLEELVITWESSNPEIAEVTQDGLVKANKPGQVTIEVNVTTEEASKELALEITVVELVYTIEYELNGGQNSELNPAGFANSDVPVELYPATKLGYKFLGWEYEGKIVEEIQEARNVKLVAKWELEEYSISYDAAGGEYEGEAVESYTVNDSVVFPVPTKEGYEFKGWYAGEELVEEIAVGSTGNLELVAKWEVVEYAINYDLAGGEFEEGTEAKESYSIEDAVTFAVPVREGYRFLGWYAGEELVEGIEKGSTGEVSVVAKWEAGYYIEFDVAGGELSLYASFDEFMDAFFAEYVAVCQAEQSATITKDTFHSNSHPSIKTFFGDAERLAKYHWLIAYIDAELREYNAGKLGVAYVADTLTMLELMLAGDTAAISASGYGPNGRTLLRNFIHGMLNHNTGSASAYIPYTPDFSNEAQRAEVVAAPGAPFLQEFYQVGAELPVPTKEGYIFEGWYSEKGELVETATVGGTLTAHWRDYYVIDFDLNGGEWEGLFASFEEIGEAYLADFNSYGNASLTKQNYFGDSTPGIKASFGNAEMLAKWNWLLVYMLEDLIAYNTENGKIGDSYVKDAIGTYIPQMIAGDTTAINCNDGGNTRTLVRAYLAGVMNATKGSTGQDKPNAIFTAYVPDFSLEENQKALYAAYLEAHTPSKVQIGAELPKPVKGALKFLGWANEAGEIVTVAEADGKLVAQWETVEIKSEVKFDLAGGLFAEGTEVPTEYVEGKGLETLPTPEKEGYRFAGWYLGEELVESISKDQEGDVELVAKWTEIESEPVLKVGPEEQFKTLDEAIAAAFDGYKIILAAGEYTLGVVINKNIEIVGPNADLPVSEFGDAQAIINVTKDVVGNLAAKNIVFNGVALKGVGGGGGVAGTYFQDGGGVETVVFKSCVISDMNTFVKFNLSSSSSNLELTIEDCHIHTIGQFILWMQNTGTKKVLVTGSLIDGSTCGSVTNTAAALFRIRCGSLEAYNNTFKGNSANEPGYFECSATNAGTSYIKYNKFDYVIKYVHGTATNNIVFDENLYLDSKGEVMESAHSAVKGTGVQADTTVAKSEAELLAKYYVFVNPERYFLISYQVENGQIDESYPLYYDTEVGVATLPALNVEGLIFDGWYLNDKKVTSIPAGTKGNLELVAKWGVDCLIVDGTEGERHYKTIADALTAAKEGETILIVAGEYTENVTISTANLTIIGPNSGVSAVDGTRAAEAIIKGVISVAATAKNLTIDGLAFTGAGKVASNVASGTYEGFKFLNNKVYDTNAATTQWVDNRYSMDAIVEFKLSSGGSAKNFEFVGNSFVNCPALNILVNRAFNLVVHENLFKNFTQDAIRIEGGYTNGVHSFTNNVFEVENQGDAYNGIFLYSYSGGDAFTKVVIDGNVFKNLGKGTDNLYDGAISAKTYQELPTSFDIVNNIFDNCYNILWLRNNGATASIWSANIENNQFLGYPEEYYYKSYNGTDTESTNPHLAVFGANYYEDNDGNVITDITTIASKFFHVKSYGTALEQKPEVEEAEKCEFWTITYELNGGTAKGLVTEYNTYSETIVLPIPTWNIYHEFIAWTLDGEVITEIPAGTKGDLVIVAEWEELEGNPVTLNFELNGGNWRYSSFADISADLLADYNAFGGTTYTAESLPTGAWVNINIHNFYYSEGMSEKWGWLAAWLGEVGGKSNKPGCLALTTHSDAASFAAANSNYIYEVSYEFRAVMRGSTITSNASYVTSDYSDPTLNSQVWGPLVSVQSKTLETTEGKVLQLPQAHKEYLSFVGWFDNPELTGEPITEITVGATNPTFYAKYVDLNPVTEIKVSNAISEIKRFETHQLVWEVIPAAAANKAVTFASSNEAVVKVSTEGLITAIAGGTATITITSSANSQVVYSFELTVTVPTFIEGSYETESYVNVDEEITLKAEVYNGEGTIVWSSADESIATVDQNGVVKGLKAGNVIITAQLANNENVRADFYVTVIDGELSEILSFILNNHNANIFTSYELGIGSGTPAYYADIYGSVNKILFNHKLEINTEYLEKGNATKDYYENAHLEEQYGGIQFVTFHYTAGMGATADTDNHASYFTGGSADVSIHYVTGNKGTNGGQLTSEVYQTLSHDHGAWHAGDSNARYYSNSTLVDANGMKRFQWIPTGVTYDGCDLLEIEWTASDDFYFEINGKKTSIALPDTYNYNSRGTNHIKNANGTYSSTATLNSNYSWVKFENRTPESFFNSQDFAVKVIDGEYYMGPTWWSYGQVIEGRICAVGGNMNSIGIESCVNEGSDLWLTWQISAQLIAKLLDDNGLGVERVKGHHFFDGKDCPQPLLENDMKIWYEFIESVKAELDIRQKYAGYEIEMVSNNPDIIDNNGRVIKVPEFTQAVSYTVTIKQNGEVVDTVTLGSIVPGIYEKE